MHDENQVSQLWGCQAMACSNSPGTLQRLFASRGDISRVLKEKTILSKTDLGRDAIAQRLPVLPVRLRPGLIMVDGKRSVGELAGMLTVAGGLAALEELHNLGLVEIISQPAAEPAQAEAAVVAADSGPPALSFPDYVATLKDFFSRELGPNGQILVLQIGAAPDMKTLRPLVDRGLDNLKYFKGAGAVDNFKATLGRLAPRA